MPFDPTSAVLAKPSFDPSTAGDGVGFDPGTATEISPYSAVIAEAEALNRRIAANTPEAIGARAVAPEPNIEALTPIPTGFGPSIPASIAKPLLVNAPRIGVPLGAAMSLTGVGALPGAAIMAGSGALGELGSQLIEKQIGERQQVSPSQIATMGLLSAIPAARLEGIASPMLRGGIRMAEGAGIGAAAPVVESGLRGELPQIRDVGQGALFGAALGAPFGGMELARGRVLGARESIVVPAELQAIAAARQELPLPTDILPDELGAVAQIHRQMRAEQAAREAAQARDASAAQAIASDAKVQALAERMMGKDAPDQLAILEQELQLQKGTLTPAEQRAGLEMKQLLKQQIEQQKALQQAAEAQQKAQADAQKAATEAAQPPKSAQILAESAKPPTVVDIANNISGQTSPFVVQKVINEKLTGPQPAEPKIPQIKSSDASGQIVDTKTPETPRPTMADQPVKYPGVDAMGKPTEIKTTAAKAKAKLESRLNVMRKLLDCLVS